ncbi:RHS repeat-associated core domain-containing protein [Thioalkalivibrio sp. XN279]|nr:RHS repeat-associated core domain-containing protein [Thioalkalivibrio sp. XN279]
MDRRYAMKKLWAALLLACLLVTPAQAETVTYLHTDLLGSVVLETDQNRNVVARYEYEPYGLPRQAVVDQPGYTGHVHDAGSGLVYMQQRYYDPEVGRFLSIDPVGVDLATGANFNRYWYGNENPYTYTDPDGRNAVAGIGGILTETWNLVSGRGFDRDSVVGAFADGYNGEGNGRLAAAFEDATTLGGGAVLGAATKVAAGLVKVGKPLDAAGDVAGAAKGGLGSLGRAGSRSSIRVAEGGASAAEKLFGKLSKGGVDVTPAGHPGKLVRRPDGGFVGYRGVSKSGPPTIDVNIPGIDVRKIKFPE